MHRKVPLAIAALLASLASVAASGEPVVERQGSRLAVRWESPAAGTWELRDTSGNLCASGAVGVGPNEIALAKLAAPTDVRLTVRAGGAGFTRDIRGERRVSRLEKPERAVSIYQVPARTYAARGAGRDQKGRLSELTAERLAEIQELGADYLWLTGVLEHASRSQTDPDVVKGEAGSYYAIYDNWDVSAQTGDLAEMEALIDRAHAAGLRVLIDFVPNHTARMHRTDVACKQHLDFGKSDRADAFFHRDNNYYHIGGTSFAPPPQNGAAGADGVFDTDIFAGGVQLEAPARVTGNDIVSATPAITDWFETAKLNYGFDIATRATHYAPRPRTWYQMIDVARYWIEKGVDGFRVDFAHAVPIEFWRFFAAELKRVMPDVFLLAEAYESDQRMKLPGFSYQAMLEAGFDSVYNSEMYWSMRNQATRPGQMRAAAPSRSPAMAPGIVQRGFQFTHYMENHDEIRVASRHFAPWVGDRAQRAALGLAYTAYLVLLPGHSMLHGGQELQEDASIFGPYAGDNGRTSIFDFVHQAQTRTWLFGDRPAWMASFRDRYKALIALKKREPFSLAHAEGRPTLVDLDGANWYKHESQWVASYVRHHEGEAYLVVTNSDPFAAHAVTVHFTAQDHRDTLGALAALGIPDVNERRFRFVEVFSRPGFVPHDPAVAGSGTPGWVFHKAGNVPSGLHLGEVPAATTYVFRLEEVR